MNHQAVVRLVRKDLDLIATPFRIYILAACLSVVLTAMGGSCGHTAGVTLALNVVIGASFHVMLGPVLGERERRTLAFVMSLPVRPSDVAMGKIVTAFVVFLVPATIAATTFVLVSPFDVLEKMAQSTRPWWSHALGWSAYYALVLGLWTLPFSVVLAAAVISESVGWTIAVLTGLIFVVGNGLMQVVPEIPGFRHYLTQLGSGGLALPVTIGVEWTGIALVVALVIAVQRRKTSFV